MYLITLKNYVVKVNQNQAKILAGVIKKQIDEQGIYERLICEASFYFDVSRSKASIPKDQLKQNNVAVLEVEESFENCTTQILNRQFKIPGGSVKKFVDLTSKDMFDILLMNRLDQQV